MLWAMTMERDGERWGPVKRRLTRHPGLQALGPLRAHDCLLFLFVVWVDPLIRSLFFLVLVLCRQCPTRFLSTYARQRNHLFPPGVYLETRFRVLTD